MATHHVQVPGALPGSRGGRRRGGGSARGRDCQGLEAQGRGGVRAAGGRPEGASLRQDPEGTRPCLSLRGAISLRSHLERKELSRRSLALLTAPSFLLRFPHHAGAGLIHLSSSSRVVVLPTGKTVPRGGGPVCLFPSQEAAGPGRRSPSGA